MQNYFRATLEIILPHHTFHRPVGTLVVFSVFLFVVIVQDLTIYPEIDQLADRHTGIYPHRMRTGDLQGPGIAKSYIAFTGGGVNVDPQPANAGFALQKGDGSVRFGILFRYSQI